LNEHFVPKALEDIGAVSTRSLERIRVAKIYIPGLEMQKY
jgi:hypothetical protein